MAKYINIHQTNWGDDYILETPPVVTNIEYDFKGKEADIFFKIVNEKGVSHFKKYCRYWKMKHSKIVRFE